jgi:hypothetical protein
MFHVKQISLYQTVRLLIELVPKLIDYALKRMVRTLSSMEEAQLLMGGGSG